VSFLTQLYQAGLPELATKILAQLAANAVRESRFGDAAYYFYTLAVEALKVGSGANQGQQKHIAPTGPVVPRVSDLLVLCLSWNFVSCSRSGNVLGLELDTESVPVTILTSKHLSWPSASLLSNLAVHNFPFTLPCTRRRSRPRLTLCPLVTGSCWSSSLNTTTGQRWVEARIAWY
jgi:hypothetical protein